MSKLLWTAMAASLVLGGGCGGNSCKKACKKIAKCLGITDGGTAGDGSVGGNWVCPLSDTCSPDEKCRAKCINAASCEAFTSPASQAAQELQSCSVACAGSTADGGGEGIPSDLRPFQEAQPPLDGSPDEGGTCVPQCTGKQCGDDGCGGSCGTCNPPATCDPTGQCVGGGGCGAVTYEGCCEGEILKYCEESQLQTTDCTSSPSCGWNATSGYYDCGTDGGAEPTGQHPKSCP